MDEDEDNTDPITRDFAVNLPMVLLLAVACLFLGGSVTHLVSSRSDRLSATSVDVGFYRDMTFHHGQAIQMAVLEQRHGTDPEIQSFAMEIIRSQSYQLGVMADLLARYGYSPEVGPTVMAWMGPPYPRDLMPGLATDAQMTALGNARGADSDKLFLTLMTAHHRGGIHMATYAYEHAKLASVRELAQRMAWDQAVDINEFRRQTQLDHIDVTIEPQATTVPNPYA